MSDDESGRSSLTGASRPGGNAFAEPGHDPRWFAGPVVIAAAGAAVLLVLADRYGWHRDELYFRAAGERLSWGYVDQPPLVPFLARVSTELFGASLTGLRAWSAAAYAAIVVLAAATARELGGGRWAQLSAAVLAAVSSAVVTIGHLLATATFDALAWTTVLFLVVRVLRTGDDRLWLVVGAVAGLGLLNKHLVLVLGAALVVALAADPGTRRHLRSRWLWIGGALAALLLVPNILWHASNDWPVFEMSSSLREESGVEGSLLFVPSQLVVLGPLHAIVWIAGLLWLLRTPSGRRWRPVGVAFLLLAAAMIVLSGKPYYLLGSYAALIAAGTVAIAGWRRRTVLVAAVAASALGTWLFVVPILPAETVADLGLPDDLEQEITAQFGWEAQVAAAASAFGTIPETERDGAVILTANYGEAGAIERYGDTFGLPDPISAHNNYWLWGFADAGDGPTVVVGYSAEFRDEYFADCRVTARFEAPHGMLSEETGREVAVCAGPRRPWPAIWPELKHYE